MKIKPYPFPQQKIDAWIASICNDFTGDKKWLKAYLTATYWRTLGDYAAIQPIVNPKDSILEIAGTPPLLGCALQESFPEATFEICDIDTSAYDAFLQKHAIAQSSSSDIQEGILSTKKETYDVVICCELIEHLSGNILKALDAITRKVSPQGYLYITTPDLRSYAGLFAIFVKGSGLASKPRESVRQQYEKAIKPPFFFGHVREFTNKEVIDLVKSFGFEWVRTYEQPLSYRKPFLKLFSNHVQCAIEHLFPSLSLMKKYLFKKNAQQD
ncbi:MAG: hypothetical protein A2Y14_05485 [Verrucomicrobia bacterium GWF2_51_19]|nr:MAG: hypothetical protein A2Y14_05485 [Verrucomicrobia bacterium GWF2_51_19]HCJ12463.1 hypothetical protein [Opitutae bacterium]